MKRFSIQNPYPTHTTQVPASWAYLLLLTMFISCLPALAAVRVWDGSSGGLWSVGANWSGSVAPQNGDEVHFPGGVSRRTITNDIPNLQVTFLWFTDNSATNYILKGNALTIGGQ